jgi:hypothetical protein
VFVDLPCKVVDADEIWAFCYAKNKNVPEEFKGTPGYGDVWTFTAICADTKLVPSWLVGERTSDDAEVFLTDLASRMADRIQLSTDGHRMYEGTVGPSFRHKVDWAQIHKTYASGGEPGKNTARPSAPERSAWSARATPTRIGSRPATWKAEPHDANGDAALHAATNGFSKVENLAHSVSLHFLHYNFARPHKALKERYPRTPAMAAGVADHVWSLEEIAALLD